MIKWIVGVGKVKLVEEALFAEFASVCDGIRATTSKNAKVNTLADYLKRLDEESLKIACIFLSGRIFPRGSSMDLNVGYSLIWDAIAEVSNLRAQEMRETYIRHGDMGELAEVAVGRRKMEPLLRTELNLRYIYDQFRKIAGTSGSGATEEKRKLITGLIVNCSPAEARYLAKLVLSELRIGLVGGLVELAIAKAFGRDLGDVRDALLVAGEIGEVAVLAKKDRLASAVMKPLTSVSFMLADVMFSAGEVAEYYGRELVSEYKYDGIRAQMHKAGGEIRIFSRKLADITEQFPEIVDSARKHEKDRLIVDGEIVPFRDSRPLPFSALQRRLRKKNVDPDLVKEIPLFYVVYDVLYLDGSSMIKEPLSRRKEVLDRLGFTGHIMNAPYRMLGSEAKITEMFEESRSLGHEGLVMKDPASAYQPGKRGKHWVKLKRELDTIDAVIVVAEYGHGKRAGVLSDYTFAVNDDGQLKVIGKAYSGLTDEEIGEMTARLRSTMIRDEGYRIITRPEVVLEVAFDGIQRSERHDSGYALRFPRIKRIRHDKDLNDIDTLEKVRTIYNRQRTA